MHCQESAAESVLGGDRGRSHPAHGLLGMLARLRGAFPQCSRSCCLTFPLLLQLLRFLALAMQLHQTSEAPQRTPNIGMPISDCTCAQLPPSMAGLTAPARGHVQCFLELIQ